MLNPTALRRAFVAATIAWAAALPLATWAASGRHGGGSTMFALAIYGLASAVCHQRPERSFYLWSTKMPICGRCAGIYAGGALAAAIGSMLPPAAARQAMLRTALIAAAVPSGLTLIYEWMTGIMPSGMIRALAGAPIGAAVVWMVLTATLPEVN